ncbi:MAG: penicillin-binding protein [Deltaproteobacteria bacterium]|nr:penicillin-binding protein [Deltaproteobacteria bacterium]
MSSPERATRRPVRWRLLAVLLALVSGGAGVIFGAVTDELATSRRQASWLAYYARGLGYATEIGPSDAVPTAPRGPYDHRMGYAQLPAALGSLAAHGYTIDAQARVAPAFAEISARGLFPIFHEKTQTGLAITDAAGRPLYASLYPERVYPSYDAIPAVVTQILLYIENRELLDPPATRNPAVEWKRFGNALLNVLLKYIEPDRDVPGGSTLATQLEKYRHSPEGRTTSGRQKLEQMASASLRAYLDGEDTTGARMRTVLDYVNSVPLAAAPGYGEVNGIGDGLWAWFGTDLDDASRLLRAATERDVPEPLSKQRALALKQVLGLFLAQRRPTYYLLEDPAALDRLADTYLLLLANEGILPLTLASDARSVKLEVRPAAPRRPPASFLERKAVNAIRTRLLGTLDLPGFYDLDRFDLSVEATLDREAQAAVTRTLHALLEPANAQAAGLIGAKMLERGDPSKLVYSFTLYERVGDENRLRIQTDNYDQPLDINEGVKLELGSTAKLRTLVSYLQIVAALHGRYAGLSKAELAHVPVDDLDRLSRWAIDYLRSTSDRSLRAMCEAAMDREYSASPGEAFFTGGGLHSFVNFNKDDDGRVMTVREGIRNSVNLVFIRLMRDVVRYHTMHVPGSSAMVLQDVTSPARRAYLERFADQEGSVFLSRFYKKYEGQDPDGVFELFLAGVRPAPRRLSMAFRATHPDASAAELERFLRERLPASDLDAGDIAALYSTYDPRKFSLADQGYLIRCHPLELWLVTYLRAPERHPRRGSRGEQGGAPRRVQVAVPGQAQERAGQAHPPAPRGRGVPRDPPRLEAPRLPVRDAGAVLRDRDR